MQRRLKNEKFTERAFSRVGAGERPHGVYTEGGEALAIAGASLSSTSTPLGKHNAPLGCGDGITFLEHYIHHKALAGDRRAVREALYEYLKLSGGLCK